MEKQERLEFIQSAAQALREGNRERIKTVMSDLEIQSTDQMVELLIDLASALKAARCPKNITLFCPHIGSGCRKDDTCIIYELWESRNSA